MTLKEELQKKNSIPFPEGKIVTLDGRSLDCLPRAKHQIGISNERQSATIGQCLSLKTKRRKERDMEKAKNLEKLFTDNAFYLLAHKDRIMSDSRMFLCQVEVQNGIYYTGTFGFRNPTVGGYLEWWSACDNTNQKDEHGEMRLVYYLSDSPMSGINNCGVVYQNGRTERISLPYFISCWPIFIDINSRYDNAKKICQSYSLQQVLDILHQEDNGNTDFARDIETEMMKKEIIQLAKQAENAVSERELWHKKYNHLLLQHKDKEVRKLYDDYVALEIRNTAEIEQLKNKSMQIRSDFKNGNITNLQYQPLIMPINKRKQHLRMELELFKILKVRDLFPDSGITFEQVVAYVKTSQTTVSDK